MRRSILFPALGSVGLSLFLMNAAGAATIPVQGSIQAAVDQAQPGDTITIPAGVYHESVEISIPNLTLQASRNAILDGGPPFGDTPVRNRSFGIFVSPGGIGSPATAGERGGVPPMLRGFTLTGLQVRNFSFAGLVIADVSGYRVSNTQFSNPGAFGIYSTTSDNGLLRFNSVSGASRVGVELSEDTSTQVTNCSINRNIVGVAAESCTQTQISLNVVSDNAAGIIVDLRPDLDASYQGAQGAIVSSNVVATNNRSNPYSPLSSDPLGLVPAGSGILNIGLDNVRIENNLVVVNNSIGIGVLGFPDRSDAAVRGSGGVDFLPDNTRVVNNRLLKNGQAPDPRLALLGLHGADLLWDGTGSGNHWANNGKATTFPSQLP